MSPRILVVEDEEKWREQFRDLLEGMHLEVDAVDAIKHAKSLLEHHEYALILLDVALDQSYFTLACQQFCIFLKQNYPHVALVATTGKLLTPPEMWTLSESGVLKFIYKINLLLPDFQRIIQEALQQRHNSVVSNRSGTERLIEILKHRLRILQEQQAFYGIGAVPPHIQIDIEAIEAQIAKLQSESVQEGG